MKSLKKIGTTLKNNVAGELKDLVKTLDRGLLTEAEFQKAKKRLLKDITHKFVPKEIMKRPKMGFGVPIDSWLRGPLKEWAEDLLDEKKIKEDGFLNAKVIKVKWNEHISGRRNWQYHLWDVLMFQAWLEAQHA